jgi:hypothetical protein
MPSAAPIAGTHNLHKNSFALNDLLRHRVMLWRVEGRLLMKYANQIVGQGMRVDVAIIDTPVHM